MMFKTIEVTRGSRVAVIWMNRPECHHALNATMALELTQAIEDASQHEEVDALVLASRGDSFCSGTDLNWFQNQWDTSDQTGKAPDAALAALLRALDTSSVPVIARVNGHCVGVGVGLAAAADITVACHQAEFTQSETCLGMTPHLVAPYLIRAIGARSAGRWLMTGESFSAAEAWRLGLVHEICEASELDTRINLILGHLMTAERGAVQSTRSMVKTLASAPVDKLDPYVDQLYAAHGQQRAMAQEGIAAFLEKRWPSWAPDALK